MGKVSYTQLATYNKCPRQYQEKYILKSVEFVPNEAAERGKRIHKQLEYAVRDGTPVSAGIWTPGNLLKHLHGAGAQAEAKLETPTMIGYADVLLGNYVVDWKTGKVRPDPLQADVYATLLREMRRDPYLPVHFTWVYVDQQTTRKASPDKFAADRVHDNTRRMLTDKRYAPQPSPLCAWCPITWCRHHPEAK